MTYDPALGQQIRRKLKLEQRRGVLGNIDGQCDVPGKPSMYYVREYQSAGALGIVKEVPLSFPMQPVPGLAVTLGYNNDNQWAIIDIDREGILAAGDNPIIHNPSHPAVYNSVSPSQWLELSGYSLSTAESPSMLVCIRSLIVYRNGAFSQYLPDEDNPTDLTAFIPSSGEHLFACVWLKTDNTIEVTTSTAQSELDPLDFSDIQECAAGATVGSIPAWVWQLTGGMTAIDASTPNQSVRPIINMIDTAGSGFAPDDATYITQTPNADLTNEQALSALGTGLMISTTATGVVSTVAAPTGAVVGDTDAQTLSNKTLTAPTIANLTNATHTHQNAAGGGTLDAAAVASGTFNTARIPSLPASIITSGQLPLDFGGTEADLSATGGANQIVKQSSAGGALTVGLLTVAEIPTLTSAKISDLAWVFLDEDTLGGSAASITIDTSAFSGYDHFKLIWKGRSDRASNPFDDLLMRFNADSATAAYAGTGTAFSTGTAYQEILVSTAGITGVPVYLGCTAATATANRFTELEIFIHQVQIAAIKLVSYYGFASSGNGTTASGHIVGGGWWNSNSAITEILLLPRNGTNFTTGTNYTLLGCKT